MTYTPFVSVIVPNYNYAQYLEQRMETILNQTYQNFEVIILDDCSTDNSLEIIEKYRLHSNVREVIVNEHNSGSPFKQWNKGIRLAKGDLIWIAEADDYCEPNFLEELVRAFCSVDDCAVTYSLSYLVDLEGKYIGKIPYRLGGVSIYSSAKEYIPDCMSIGCDIWNGSSAIFDRRKALLLTDRYTQYTACGDKMFWISLSEQGSMVRVNQPLNFFRQHGINTTSRKIRSGVTHLEEYQIYKYIIEKGYLCGWRKYETFNYYIQKIYATQYDSSLIRKEIISLWANRMIINAFVVNLFKKFFHLIRLIRNI